MEPIRNNRIVDYVALNETLQVLKHTPGAEKSVKFINDLLLHQLKTATEITEIGYLGLYGEYTLPKKVLVLTEDNIEIFEDEDITLYSCMKNPHVGEQILIYHLEKWKCHAPNPNRVYFFKKENCQKYIDYNKPKYSQAYIDSL